mgnify:FL=1|jgi:hypothetical protein
MGDWSDAMDDGVICRGCALPLGERIEGGGYCASCASERTKGNDNLGPRWLPDNSQDRNPRR